MRLGNNHRYLGAVMSSRTCSSTIVLLLALVLVLTPHRSQAQVSTAVPPVVQASRLFTAAQTYKDAGNFLAAIPLLEEASILSPDDYRIWLELVSSYFDAGRYDDAVESATRAVESNPSSALAYAGRGLALQMLNRCDEGISDLQYAIELDPMNANSHSSLGTCFMAVGEFHEATIAFLHAVELDPTTPRYRYNLGNSYGALGDCANAIQSYDDVIELDSTHLDAYNNKANCLQSLGRYEDAISTIDVAINILPTSQFLANKAEYLRNLGRYAEALQAANDALSLDASYARAYRSIGNIYFDQGLLTYAVEAYKDGTTYDPDDLSVWRNLGIAHYLLEDYSSAAEAWEVVVRNGYDKSEYHRVFNDLAYLYADKLESDLLRALELANIALELADEDASDYASVLDTLAWIHYKLGNCSEAATLIEDAASRDPENREILDHKQAIDECN